MACNGTSQRILSTFLGVWNLIDWTARSERNFKCLAVIGKRQRIFKACSVTEIWIKIWITCRAGRCKLVCRVIYTILQGIIVMCTGQASEETRQIETNQFWIVICTLVGTGRRGRTDTVTKNPIAHADKGIILILASRKITA